MAGDEKRYFVALFTLRIATNGDATERKNLEFIVLWPDTSSATSCNRDYNKNYTQLAFKPYRLPLPYDCRFVQQQANACGLGTNVCAR